MDHRSELSVDELRRQTENTRASLSTTVDKLREAAEETAAEWKAKVSPNHIKQEVKDYVRKGGERLSDSLRQKVKENPLQALAVGAALAYPLMGLLRAVPAPVLLIGAGYWLAQRKNGQSSDTASENSADAPSTIPGAEVLTEHIRKTAYNTRDAANRLSDDVLTTARTVGDGLTNKLSEASVAASATAEAALDKVSQVGERSRNALADTIDKNPLLVAGVGLAIGAVIAASLPASVPENRLFGKASDKLKRTAGRAATESMDRAKEVAEEVIGEIADSAQVRGLNADHVKRLAEDVVSSAKAVADRGLQAAFEDPPVAPSWTAQQQKTWVNQ